MIEIVWSGWIYDKYAPLIGVKDGQYIKLQGQGSGYCNLVGILNENCSSSNIGLIRTCDLRYRNKACTENIYMADISGYKYISVQNGGFKKIYCVIYKDKEEYEPSGEENIVEIRQKIIVDNYKSTIKIRR